MFTPVAQFRCDATRVDRYDRTKMNSMIFSSKIKGKKNTLFKPKRKQKKKTDLTRYEQQPQTQYEAACNKLSISSDSTQEQRKKGGKKITLKDVTQIGKKIKTPHPFTSANTPDYQSLTMLLLSLSEKNTAKTKHQKATTNKSANEQTRQTLTCCQKN
jgi:hypothetical protein